MRGTALVPGANCNRRRVGVTDVAGGGNQYAYVRTGDGFGRGSRRALRQLGSIKEILMAWDLDSRLARISHHDRGVTGCLACTVEISRRAKTVAGTAYTQQRRIVLHASLLKAGREADRDATLLHECAHIIANVQHGVDCGHDHRWRDIMSQLGEPCERCHSLDYLSAREHAKVTWVCNTCGQEYHFVRRPRRRLENCWCASCGRENGRLRVKPE